MWEIDATTRVVWVSARFAEMLGYAPEDFSADPDLLFSTAHADDQTLDAAVRAAARALGGGDRTLAAGDLEVAMLSRRNGRRCFRRLGDEAVAAALAG